MTRPLASATPPGRPHFAKAEGEPKRVQPSKARSAAKPFSEQLGEGFGAQRFRKRSAAKSSKPAETSPADAATIHQDTAALTEELSSLPEGEASASHIAEAVPSEEATASQKPARKAPGRRVPRQPLITVAQLP